jgi:hypothetical protein
VNWPFISPRLEAEAANLPSVTGNGPEAVVSIDPADIPSHFTSFRVTLTEVIDAPSSETTKQITPLLALPLIAMGPLKEHLGGVGKGGKVGKGGEVGKGSSTHHSGVGVGVDVGVGVGVGMDVGVGVDVGRAGVGASVACGLHPNSSNRVNPIPQTFFNRFLRFIRTSSV